jgi:methylated-DNA-protein-cysteine methyltransferase-like protein
VKLNKHYSRIWQTVLLVPRGRVSSYGQIADLAGLPGRARLVGKALQFSADDIPWHRILRSNGQIAFPAGSQQAECQKGLLQDEGVVVMNNRVKLTDFQWRPDLAEMLWRLEY